MAEIVNLRAWRKAAERARKRADADANAAKHGRTKSEATLQKARAAKERVALDAHRLDAASPRSGGPARDEDAS
jgi:hypothetical protein